MAQIITIIGTGNVAWHLAPALERAGHVINEVYGLLLLIVSSDFGEYQQEQAPWIG